MDNKLDTASTLQPSQLILIGILLGVLLIWMLVFTWLAIRPHAELNAEEPEMPAALPMPIARASLRLRTIAQAPIPAPSLTKEASGEVVLEGSVR